jgi:hypothetical protein
MKLRLEDHQFDIDDRMCITYDIPLQSLLKTLDKYRLEDNLQIRPDFQRGHEWNVSQQIQFCEFMLKRGLVPPLLLNHPGWFTCFKGTMQLVDGLQRLIAIELLMQNKLKVWGHYLSEFEDWESWVRGIRITIRIHSLQTKAEVLRWYLQVNATGTPHSTEEIDRVKKLLEIEGNKND